MCTWIIGLFNISNGRQLGASAKITPQVRTLTPANTVSLLAKKPVINIFVNILVC